MRVYVDRNGTLINNVGGIADAAVAQAVEGMREAGHEVEICSAMPEEGQLDKGRVLSSDLRGAALIDDEHSILSCALRRGAIAVPAHQILAFATVLVAVSR